MKKYLIILVTIVTSITLINCKKSNSPKDYVVSIKDKTWGGMFTNAGEQAQYYSVHFREDNSLDWSQLSGDYTGKWSVDENKLTLIFTTPAVTITAEIAADSTLKNISTNTANKVNTGKMIENTDILLDNSTWIGSMPANSSKDFRMSFYPGNKVVLSSAGIMGANGTFSYIKDVSHSTIRFSIGGYPFFGVIISGNEIQGSYSSPENSWQVIKQ